MEKNMPLKGIWKKHTQALEGRAYSLYSELAEEITAVDALERVAIGLENLADDATSLNPEIITILESVGITNVSVESAGDRIKDVVKTILEFVRRIWKGVASFFANLFSETEALRVRSRYLRIVAKELTGRAARADTVDVGGHVVGMATESGVPHDAATLDRGLKELLAQLSTMRLHYIPAVMDAGVGISQQMAKWNAPNVTAGEWLMGLNDAASKLDHTAIGASFNRKIVVNDNRFDDTAFSAPPLPGMRSLVVVDAMASSSGQDTPIARAYAMQRSKIVLTRLRPDYRPSAADAQMRVMPIVSIYQTLDLVDALLTEIEIATKAGLNRRLAEVSDSMASIAKRLSTQRDLDGEQASYLRRGLAYTQTYSRWASEPYIGLIAQSLFVSRHTLAICSRHLNAYKNKGTAHE